MKNSGMYRTIKGKQMPITQKEVKQTIMDLGRIAITLNQQDKRIKELEQENLSLQEQSIRDNQNWIEETTQLKQQLHDLPKKIAGEIKKELYDCGKTYLEDEPYIEICIVQGILNTILKKYGGD